VTNIAKYQTYNKATEVKIGAI